MERRLKVQCLQGISKLLAKLKNYVIFGFIVESGDIGDLHVTKLYFQELFFFPPELLVLYAFLYAHWLILSFWV